MQRETPARSSLNSQGGKFPTRHIKTFSVRGMSGPAYSLNKIIFLSQFYTVTFVRIMFVNTFLQIIFITPCELAVN